MKKQNHGHRWSDDELKRFIALWADNDKPVSEIAALFSVTEHACYKMAVRLRESGVPCPQRKRGHKPHRCNKPWTQEEVEFLVRRRNEGVTAGRIGMELGRTFQGVQEMIQALRKKGVPVRMLGMGVRRLWDPQRLIAAAAGRGLVPREEDYQPKDKA